VESKPPSSSTPPTPPKSPPPPGGDGGGDIAASTAPSTEELPNIEIVICPVCKEPRAEDARFCEECGHDYGTELPPPVEERPTFTGPVLWAIMLFWAALAIGGLFFLYNALWAI
jgi:hypothetical protein